MVLVPTTILAQQHYGTFRERFADFPVKVEMISRFRSAAEQKQHPQGLRRRQGGRAHRHPPAALAGRQAQGPGPGHRRRGAALRRGPEGGAAAPEGAGWTCSPSPPRPSRAPCRCRCPGCATSPSSRRRRATATPSRPTWASTTRAWSTRAIEREIDRGGQVFYLHNRVETIDKAAVAPARAHAAGALRRGPRADARAGAGAGDARLPARRLRRAGEHHHHRERARHPQRQHAHRGAGRPAGAGPALPDPRPHRPLQPGWRTPSSSIPTRRCSPRRPSPASPPWPTTPSWAPASRSPCATWRSGGPASCWARSSPARSPPWASRCTCRCCEEAAAAAAGRGSAARRSVPRVDIGIDAHVPTELHRLRGGPGRPAPAHRLGRGRCEELADLRAELIDRFGELPEPVDNLIFLGEVRVPLQEAGRRFASRCGSNA